MPERQPPPGSATERYALPHALIAPLPPAYELAPPEPTTREPEPVLDPRSEKQRQVLDRLEQGIEAVLTDEGFRAYLQTLSRFHTYSFANTILIHSQKPDATRVAGYRKWQELGRQVKRGESAIKIFYPMFTKREDPETGEEERVLSGYGIGNVFDVSSTEGEPLPEPPKLMEDHTSDERAKEVNLRLSRWLIGEGLRLKSEDFPGLARGYYLPTRDPKEIVIRSDVYVDEWAEVHLVDPLCVVKTKTLAHEAAHYCADHRGQIDRKDAETVAEASAFVVMEHFGLDVAEYSFTYLASWGADKERLRTNLGEIGRVANRLITAVEGETGTEDFF